MILCPLLPAFFFQVSHNFMKHCSWSVFLSLIFSFPLSFLAFSPFLSARLLFSWYFFPIRPYLFPPPPPGVGGIFQYIDPWFFLLCFLFVYPLFGFDSTIPESIERLTEGQAFLRWVWFGSMSTPSLVSNLDRFTPKDWERGNLLTGEGGKGVGVEPNPMTARKPCPL